MDPRDIARSYDALADHWIRDRFSKEYGIEAHRRAIAFSNGGGKALDIGCGSSGRILDLLQSSGFEAEGLDISERMITLAQQGRPDFVYHQADICEWQFPHPYDFISAWDSLWHVQLAQQERVFAKVLAGLAPRGVIIWTTGGMDGPSETQDAAMGRPMYHSTLGIPRILEVLAAAGCICRHLEYDQLPERHVYLIAQKSTGGP